MRITKIYQLLFPTLSHPVKLNKTWAKFIWISNNKSTMTKQRTAMSKFSRVGKIRFLGIFAM